jgi:DNA (cytosine-5)-methyltransferase 1
MKKVGSDFSGVGAFNQALIRLGIEYKEIFACDMDKYARQTFIHNYGEPKYYPTNVYDREIPSESLDIYMTSPPCQAFSLAGKRLGKDDKRGILFFNSHEFIQVNKPRFFIFENVKGLLSDDGGKTFQEWVNMLGGKSVNGVPVIFPYEDSVPYHLYWKVLNAKHHGVPQNRERVFLIGIRDDQDNVFQFPKEEYLSKRLKDVLENQVEDKYFLSDKLLSYFADHKEMHKERGNGFKFEPHTDTTMVSNAISTKCGSRQTDPYIKIKSATSKGYEEATEGDSINFSVPNSETRTGRVGKGVAQTLDTACDQGVIQNIGYINQDTQASQVYSTNGICPTLSSGTHGYAQGYIKDYKIRRLTPKECFRLMDFPDTFTWPVSDSQAYKQAGNSIVVNVLYKILKQLPL